MDLPLWHCRHPLCWPPPSAGCHTDQSTPQTWVSLQMQSQVQCQSHRQGSSRWLWDWRAFWFSLWSETIWKSCCLPSWAWNQDSWEFSHIWAQATHTQVRASQSVSQWMNVILTCQWECVVTNSTHTGSSWKMSDLGLSHSSLPSPCSLRSSSHISVTHTYTCTPLVISYPIAIIDTYNVGATVFASECLTLTHGCPVLAAVTLSLLVGTWCHSNGTWTATLSLQSVFESGLFAGWLVCSTTLVVPCSLLASGGTSCCGLCLWLGLHEISTLSRYDCSGVENFWILVTRFL